jgi:hypothetical protein
MADDQNTVSTGTTGTPDAPVANGDAPQPAAPQPILQVGGAIPSGATIGGPAQSGLQVGAPIPQGATIGSPLTEQGNAQKTALQNFTDSESNVPANSNPLTDNPEVGKIISGATKSAASGLGGVWDMITNAKGNENTRRLDPQGIASLYKELHPAATPQQIAAYVNNVISDPKSAPSQTVMDVSQWLHSAGQPAGFWENVGSIGEQALEWIGMDGISKLATAPLKEVAAAKTATTLPELDTVAHAKAVSAVTTFLKENPKIAGLVTVGLKASKDALGVGVQNYAHNEDPNEAVNAGLLGGALGAPLHAIGELAGSVADAGDELTPTHVNVAGQDIPVAATHPELPQPTSLSGKIIQGAATKAGATNFVANEVQPAAVNAVQKNFAQSASDVVDQLNKIQNPDGEAQVVKPTLDTVDQTAKYMKGEAQKTYQKLDAAGQADIDAWEAKYGKDAKAKPTVTMMTHEDKLLPIDENGNKIPPKPKLFTELQDQISDTKSTIGNSGASQVDKQQAIKDLPMYEQEMKDFLTKHGQAVNPGELDAANSTYSKGLRYDYLADKLRQATKGAGSGTLFNGDITSLSPKALENLPRQYETKFGEGSFTDLLGSKGAKNYNDIVNTLKTPKTGRLFFQMLQHLPLYVGKIGTIPSGAVADKILFDPVAGQRVLNAFREIEETANATAKAPGVAASAGGVLHSTALKNAYKQVASPLGGKSSDSKSGTSFFDSAGASTAPGKLIVQLPKEIQDLVDKYAQKHGVPINLARAVIFHESQGNPNATGKTTSKGEQAKGLGQLLPHTATELGVDDPYDPNKNLEGSMKYLSRLYQQHGKNPLLAYAAYTSGPNRVKPGDTVQDVLKKLPPEGQKGVKKVASLLGIDVNTKPDKDPYMVYNNPKGLIAKGNLPIWTRPTVNNSDGSHSSEYSTSFTDERPHSKYYNKEVLMPTIVNGKFLTPDGKKPKEGSAAERAMFEEARKHYYATGEQLGVFDNPDNADTYATILHNRGKHGGSSGSW